MRVVPGPDGWPEAYDYVIGSRTVRFEQGAALPPILHLTQFHPLDDHYGLSSLEAAAVALPGAGLTSRHCRRAVARDHRPREARTTMKSSG